jgi:general stress protein YciG
MERKNKSTNNQEHGEISVNEAGRRGGEATSATHGREFYEDIGHMGGQKGGQRVKELIEEGKEAEDRKYGNQNK